MTSSGAIAFNQPIGEWDTSKFTSTVSMFHGASAFNQPIGDWDTSSISWMDDMFSDASVFYQPVGDWDIGKISTMKYMFTKASVFNQNLCSWGKYHSFRHPHDFEHMFSGSGCPSQDLPYDHNGDASWSWYVSKDVCTATSPPTVS